MSDTAKTYRREDLRQFTGTEQWFRHGFIRRILYTDGVKYVAETAGAYWLIDEIACAQVDVPAVIAESFQFWRLAVRANSTGTLTCEDGNGHAVYSKELDYTDFPVEGVELYFTNNVILVPSEY